MCVFRKAATGRAKVERWVAWLQGGGDGRRRGWTWKDWEGVRSQGQRQGPSPWPGSLAASRSYQHTHNPGGIEACPGKGRARHLPSGSYCWLGRRARQRKGDGRRSCGRAHRGEGLGLTGEVGCGIQSAQPGSSHCVRPIHAHPSTGAPKLSSVKWEHSLSARLPAAPHCPLGWSGHRESLIPLSSATETL